LIRVLLLRKHGGAQLGFILRDSSPLWLHHEGGHVGPWQCDGTWQCQGRRHLLLRRLVWQHPSTFLLPLSGRSSVAIPTMHGAVLSLIIPHSARPPRVPHTQTLRRRWRRQLLLLCTLLRRESEPLAMLRRVWLLHQHCALSVLWYPLHPWLCCAHPRHAPLLALGSWGHWERQRGGRHAIAQVRQAQCRSQSAEALQVQAHVALCCPSMAL
jgi:hypothetical protein